MPLLNWLHSRLFNAVHGRNLIYNTCWEDPRLDRIALDLRGDDTVMVITSAGCNALDYALASPARIHAVDVNPRQNALLELKMAGIRTLSFTDFFQWFGKGCHADCRRLYAGHMRRCLSPPARTYWDRRITFFENQPQRRSFYFRGTVGFFAYLVNAYINHTTHLRPCVEALLNARTMDEQQALYYDHLHEQFWRGWFRWMAGQDASMCLLGVPRAQIEQIKRHHRGIIPFVMECLEAVFALLPLADNYFWRVYLTGEYTAECCPEYLRPAGFEALKGGLVDRIQAHTATVHDFLANHDGTISRFVLLDHMDWLSSAANQLLREEWQQIVDTAAPGARIIWRSGGLYVDYVDPLPVRKHGQLCRLADLLDYKTTLAADLHARDRVHTYGSFYIADLSTA